MITIKLRLGGIETEAADRTPAPAIAAGKKAADAIGRFVRGEPAEGARHEPPKLAAEARECSFHEVEQPLPEEEAGREARRRLRCDLEFPRPEAQGDGGQCAQGGGR